MKESSFRYLAFPAMVMKEEVISTTYNTTPSILLNGETDVKI